jgi:hypothetical protein
LVIGSSIEDDAAVATDVPIVAVVGMIFSHLTQTQS